MCVAPLCGDKIKGLTYSALKQWTGQQASPSPTRYKELRKLSYNEITQQICSSAINAVGVRGPPAFWTWVQTQIWVGGFDSHYILVVFFGGGGLGFLQQTIISIVLCGWGLLLIFLIGVHLR